MFMKRSSGPLYTKDDLLQRIEKGINRNTSNGENFIPDYSKSKESSLTTRYESFIIWMFMIIRFPIWSSSSLIQGRI